MLEKVRGLVVTDWPAADRAEWGAAIRPTVRLQSGGRAAHLRQSTQVSLVRGYGLLLDFCHRSGRFNPDVEASGHVTPPIIEAFLAELEARVGSVARASYIYRVRRMAEILAPQCDLDWLKEIEIDLGDAVRPRPKHNRIVDADRLLALGLDLIGRGEHCANRTDLQRARLMRDGLMIALLALCPIRLRNLAELTLDKSIRKQDDTWWIVLAAADTKSGRPDERPIAPILTAYIDRWIEHWRSMFIAPGDAFWASIKGGGLAYTFVGTVITRTTRRELGTAVNPHLFRDCAVHTVATHAGAEMGMASGLLQHTDPRTTEKHYNKGASLNAARRFADMIQDLEEG